MKKILLAAIAVGIMGGGAFWYVQSHSNGPALDYKNATYTIEGVSVRLVDGSAETSVGFGSTAKTITKRFGNEATGDLNGDGTPDAAFLLTQSRGGSGTFYYVAVAVNTSAGYQGTNAVLLGDRIAPQSTQIKNGTLIVNYAERKPSEPMTATPSMGVTKRFALKELTLIEVRSGR